MSLLPAQLIRLKRDGHEIPTETLREFVLGYTAGKITEYQMAAFLMAVFFRGMTPKEMNGYVQSIMDSGKQLKWEGHPRFLVDKHSTGGIGDKTSMILGPIVAAAGLSVPMMAGRGLGHTGGTLDKLESIPGFSVDLTIREFEEQVLDLGLAFIGQTPEICPADKKLYALRDVTGTVESTPLVCGSILSKKLAEGIRGLVLDVKFGDGAFFKDFSAAEHLAKSLKSIGENFGTKVSVFLTSMEQPLGRYAGNSLEIFECLEILSGNTSAPQGIDLYTDTRELSLQLAAEMLFLSGKYTSLATAYGKAKEILESGKALQKWKEVCLRQGAFLEKLPIARHSFVIPARETGFVSRFETEKIGYLNIKLGAGRIRLEDQLDPTAGIEFHAKVGHPIRKGEPLITLHGSDMSLLKSHADEAQELVQLTSNADAPPASLIRSILR